MEPNYQYYRKAVAGHVMPLALVDLEAFDQNIQTILARAGRMPICVATKSIRCVALLRRIQEASPRFHSLMSFCVREAVFLSRNGFDNILVAYPPYGETESSGLCEELRAGKHIVVMVDRPEHVENLERIGAEADIVIPVCIDADMSSRYPGLHFGVRRSGLHTAEQVAALWEDIRRRKYVRLEGLMGYEAQIAGLPDTAPGIFLKSHVLKWLKKRSIEDVARRRAAIVNALRAAGCELCFVNGGGTGSIESTIQEDPVTEVTVGSGFFSPAMFDYYDTFHHRPAVMFAIEITRRPEKHIYTCAGGGYVASGAPGPERLPKPYLPEGARLLAFEGAGEVQTPVFYDGTERLEIGDPVFMRHSKAGELCERFNTLLLVSGGKIAGEVNTYRGDGQCFL